MPSILRKLKSKDIRSSCGFNFQRHVTSYRISLISCGARRKVTPSYAAMFAESSSNMLQSPELSAFARYQEQQAVLRATWETSSNSSTGILHDIRYNYTSAATVYAIYASLVAGGGTGMGEDDDGGGGVGGGGAAAGNGVSSIDQELFYSINGSGSYLVPAPTSNALDTMPTNLPYVEPTMFAFITYGILLTAIGVAGLAGNALSIVVLSSPKMKSSINCCLIGLASFDIVVLITSILMFGIKHLCDFPDACLLYNRIVYPYTVPYVYSLGMMAQTGSVWVTVTVTMERYVAVCLPLRARSLCTYGRARIYIVAITLFSIIYNLPRFWEVDRYVVEDEETGELSVEVGPSSLRVDERYINIYITWMYLFVLYFVPFIILAVLNGVIWLRVRTANRERQRLSRLQQKEMGLAIMLFCVVVVFFICNLLALMVNILERTGIIIDELTTSSNLLVTMNSSVNFVIYCIFGQKFRRILLRTVCSCCPVVCGGRRLVERSELDESVYPVSSVNTTNETKSLMHYNGNGTGGSRGHGSSRHGHHHVGGGRLASMSTATTTTLFDHSSAAVVTKHNNSSCASTLTRSSSELGDANFKMALSVSASPCTGSLRIQQLPSSFRRSSYNMLSFRSSSMLETSY